MKSIQKGFEKDTRYMWKAFAKKNLFFFQTILNKIKKMSCEKRSESHDFHCDSAVKLSFFKSIASMHDTLNKIDLMLMYISSPNRLTNHSAN